jgi:hypothetical protein
MRYGNTLLKIMEEEEGFEPPRGMTRLSVFKTDPFSRTWVFLRVDKIYYIINIIPCQQFIRIFYYGLMTSCLPIYGRNTSGIITLPSSC